VRRERRFDPAREPRRDATPQPSRSRVRALAGSLLLALALALGCQSVQQGSTTAKFRLEPGVTTRDQLYRAVGPPDAVHTRRDGREVLVYRHVRAGGMGVGVSVLMSPFRIGAMQTETDSILIDLSRDDVVVGARQYNGEASPGYPLWPGGDGSAD
jgi:hypothetical protein